MKYAIKYFQPKYMDATILLEDGGVVEIHHNGMHIVSTYYQDRLESYDQDNLDRISEGKTYCKDWEQKFLIDDEVIEDALTWLCMFCPEFTKVDFDTLTSEFNQNK
jgi:hypothetical protein